MTERVCVYRRNVLDTQNSSYLKSCRYSSESDVDRLCPIFTLGDIVREAQQHNNDNETSSYDNIAVLVSHFYTLYSHPHWLHRLSFTGERLAAGQCTVAYYCALFGDRLCTLCSEKNTHSHFLLYLHELFVDLNKNCSEYTQGLIDSDNVKIRYSLRSMT